MSTVPTAKAQVRVHIRWMIRRDMPEVLAIEHASFEFPWCEEEFLRVLRQRNCIGMVAEYGERVVGFMIYELHKNKLHVLDFATHPEFRRQGVGHQMVAKLVGKLSSHRRTRIALYVRETNLPAQLFFRDPGLPRHGGRPRALPGHRRGCLSHALSARRVDARRRRSPPTGSPSSSRTEPAGGAWRETDATRADRAGEPSGLPARSARVAPDAECQWPRAGRSGTITP